MLWSGILEKIRAYDREANPIIFEGVNLLPHLVSRDLGIPGIVIIGTSFEETLQRNMENPRWGETEALQRIEADAFFNGERYRYQSEAVKYSYPVFESGDDAWECAMSLLR